jgi:hypothetical protein
MLSRKGLAAVEKFIKCITGPHLNSFPYGPQRPAYADFLGTMMTLFLAWTREGTLEYTD